MFTFIAGVPGTGKTLYLVDQLANNSLFRDRQVFVDGIPALSQDAIPHTSLPFDGTLYDFALNRDGTKEIDQITGSYVRINPRDGLCTALNWPQWINAGDLLVVDECQRHWRVRSSGAKVPESVTELEVHRSRYSVDIIYASQKPSLVDTNVKAQVGKFFYIRKGWFGRFMYEADELFNFESRAERGLQKKRRYSLPKRSYPLYVSAQVHTKQKSGIPLAVYALPVVLAASGYGAYSTYISLDKRAHPDKYRLPSREEPATTGKGGGDASSLVNSGSNFSVGVVSGRDRADYVPQISGRPETAPLFDGLRKVAVMPIISACIKSADRCNCYTQQGSRIGDISAARCNEILDGGKLFNPYQLPVASPNNFIQDKSV